MNKKEMVKTCGILALIGVIGAGSVIGVSAYFTDMEEKTNFVTVGNVTTDLKEPEWDKIPEEEKTNITPNQVLTKDPQIENVGKNDAFVFIEVTVPVANVVTADADGTRKAAADTELFTYEINPGWVQIQETDIVAGSTVTGHQYVYAYGTSENCTVLEPGYTTPTLFNEMIFANVVEGQIDDMTLEMPVRSYAIQADNIGSYTAPVDIYRIFVGTL